MKQFYYIGSLLVLLFTSCGIIQYMNSANDMQNMPGKLYLKNGDVVDGRLTVNLKDLVKPVSIKEQNNGWMPNKLDEVKGFAISQEYFNLNTLKADLLESRTQVFMKRVTPEGSRITLYEHLYNTTTNINNNDKTVYRRVYYIRFQGDDENAVWSINGDRFIPSFNIKMSNLIKDCPELSNKILNKQKGYFYPQFNESEIALNVMLKIIDEYNRCR